MPIDKIARSGDSDGGNAVHREVQRVQLVLKGMWPPSSENDGARSRNYYFPPTPAARWLPSGHDSNLLHAHAGFSPSVPVAKEAAARRISG